MKDLNEVFEILKEYKLRLNADKCPFRLSSGNFLGHLVTCERIEANLEQIVAINDLESSKSAKEVQKLIGIAETLNRFISKSFDICCPFFQLLCKIKFFNGMKNQACTSTIQIVLYQATTSLHPGCGRAALCLSHHL